MVNLPVTPVQMHLKGNSGSSRCDFARSRIFEVKLKSPFDTLKLFDDMIINVRTPLKIYGGVWGEGGQGPVLCRRMRLPVRTRVP